MNSAHGHSAPAVKGECFCQPFEGAEDTGSAGHLVGLVGGLVKGLVLFLRVFITNWFKSHV